METVSTVGNFCGIGDKNRKTIPVLTTREAILRGHDVMSRDMTSANEIETSTVANLVQCSHICISLCAAFLRGIIGFQHHRPLECEIWVP